MTSHLDASIERFSGYTDTYDTYRPQPPAVIADILTHLARVDEAALVVDIGSGTGLSTRVWADRAREVVGVEPNADMRREAESRTDAANVRYLEGTSSATSLPDGCADIVTCSQCLHWLEPETTFTEVGRILRDGGVFAAYDCDWPPTINPEAELAYQAFRDDAKALQEQLGIADTTRQLPKEEHLDRMRASGRFRFVKEAVVHHVEPGDAERLVGLALSFGGVAGLLKRGLSEEEIGVTKLRDAARRILGDKPRPWYFSYRIRLGIK